MADKTLIAWCDHTFNVAWGCMKVSPGCKHCYADGLADRYGFKVWGPPATTPRRTFGAAHWQEPRKWQRQAEAAGKIHRVFCSSMCDVFEDHPTVTGEMARLWPLIRETPNLHWQLLTKRPERIAANLPADWGEGYPNVWLGTSIENADYAWRADHLRPIPASVRFISYEPALGPLAGALDLTGIDWVIYGGESGPAFRDHDIEWPRAMRDKCQAVGVAFFYKQSPARFTERGTTLDGETVRQYPTPRLTHGGPETTRRALPQAEPAQAALSFAW